MTNKIYSTDYNKRECKKRLLHTHDKCKYTVFNKLVQKRVTSDLYLHKTKRYGNILITFL